MKAMVVLSLVVLVAVALMPADHGWSAAELKPLVTGWEQFFKLEWQPGQRHGKPVVYGRIDNDWGFPAKDVRLLVEGLDANGRVVWQKADWLPGQLAPGTSAPFEVAVPEPEPVYRVSVLSFDWIQRGRDFDR